MKYDGKPFCVTNVMHGGLWPLDVGVDDDNLGCIRAL